eukprot:m51a1_g13973 hypothetical protein (233) ;mRNA; f:992182-993285
MLSVAYVMNPEHSDPQMPQFSLASTERVAYVSARAPVMTPAEHRATAARVLSAAAGMRRAGREATPETLIDLRNILDMNDESVARFVGIFRNTQRQREMGTLPGATTRAHSALTRSAAAVNAAMRILRQQALDSGMSLCASGSYAADNNLAALPCATREVPLFAALALPLALGLADTAETGGSLESRQGTTAPGIPVLESILPQAPAQMLPQGAEVEVQGAPGEPHGTTPRV